MMTAGILGGLMLLATAPASGGAGPVAAASPAPVAALGASLQKVRAEIAVPGARAVLVNVWATWCDACREELPAILAHYRANRGRGLRLIMVSADEVAEGPAVSRVLGQALGAAGIAEPTGIVSLIKQEDDTVFVNGLNRRWSGALPATFLFDTAGRLMRSWLVPVTRGDLEAGLRALLKPDRRGP